VRSGIRLPAARAAALAGAAALAVASARSADVILGARDATLRIDSVLWQWRNPGERPWRDEVLAELDPRGECLLVVTGAETRRLLLVRRDAAPLVVARDYLELRPPVFAPGGEGFFFSAAYGEYARDGRTYTRAGVFRAGRDGKATRIYPADAETDATAFALCLDRAPAGNSLLLGTGFALETLALPHGGFALALAELDLATNALRTFDARLNARAPAFYGRDGDGVFFNAEPPLGRLYPLVRLDPATRRTSACAWNTDSGGSPAGDLLAARRTVRHLGGFREDDFPLFFVAKTQGGPRARLELGAALAPLLGDNLALRTVRGDFALLTHGMSGTEAYAVVALARAALAPLLSSPQAQPVRYTPLRLLWGDATPEARALLLSVRARLAPPPLPRDATASYVREALDPGVRFREEITVRARADGMLLVTLATADEAGPRTVGWGRDGAASWRVSEGARADAPQSDLEVIENSYSPYRVLFDPIALLDPEIAFGAPRAEKERLALPFSYRDGYRGTLFLDARTLLPLEIESPLNRIVTAYADTLGVASRARRMRFEAWRTECGRTVPGALVCHDGVTTFRLALAKLEVDTGLADAVFLPPPAAGEGR
jgi:hypothetical protein